MLDASHLPNIIALSPFERPDARLVAAFGNAGAFGILDLGRDPEAATTAVSMLEQSFDGIYGVRIPSGVELDPETLSPQVGLVVFSAATAFQKLDGRLSLVELTQASDTGAAIEAGADGIVFKASECGGECGTKSAYMLFQEVERERPSVPFWFRGGFGFRGAVALATLGRCGVVFDGQLACLQESTLPLRLQKQLGSFDGTETRKVGALRVYDRPQYRNVLDSLANHPEPNTMLGCEDLTQTAWPVSQDAAFAASFGERFGTAKRLTARFNSALGTTATKAYKSGHLGPKNAFAMSAGIDYPILQGPMTRVSDTAAFAQAVATGGGLPFLALALMKGEAVEKVIHETASLVGERPWGVGILGFVPEQLRQEQMAAISKAPPPFCIVAGGRPSQARQLEALGTTTFLHVPSPGLLELFLKDGARRFIFEGRECGGHIGPRTSLLLWEQQLDILSAQSDLSGVTAIFAGGIHDARSAAIVSLMAAETAELGAEVGVLMGTAYLFTKEAVDAGAIVSQYQQLAIEAETTAILETAPGHATRCLDTAFATSFEEERARLVAAGLEGQEVWTQLERLNVGRLRIASKGLTRTAESPALLTVDEAGQREQGLYMIGEVAGLRHTETTIDALHREVSAGSRALLDEAAQAPEETHMTPDASQEPIAIIGMACIYPDAPNADQFWANIVEGKNSVREVPKARWDIDIYYDPDATDGSKTPCKWGGFLGATTFDPLEYGIPPKSLASIEPIQLLSLQVARDALEDAGYLQREFDREHTSVIFGAEAGTELAGAYGFRAVYPQLIGTLSESLDERLPELTEDSFPGVLANVIAGRIANRLDLGGVNYTVDAACASSIAALDLGVKELRNRSSNMVLCGGADLHNSINDYLLFSSVHALSRTGQCRSFDQSADGIVLGEGVAVVVLKRLTDAVRDGDRIYATVNGVAGSSDGRHLGLTAPRTEGQARALDRAYAQAGLSPASVELLEAHGTGTVVGDKTELETVETVFRRAGAEVSQCALGSVKTNIGHTKCAAGLAGLIKIALSVYHRVLPGTLHLETPNAAYDPDASPFTLASYSRPWVSDRRVAGVSAFGFGGTNFHAVVASHPASPIEQSTVWPTELFVFKGTDWQQATDTARALSACLAGTNKLRLIDLAYSVALENPDQPTQFAFTADDIDQLGERLTEIENGLTEATWLYTDTGVRGKVAFLMPGQGSQKTGMMAELFQFFPRLHKYLAAGKPWVPTLFPPTAFTEEARSAQQAAITDTRVAQPTLGMVDMATASALERFGLRPDMVAGHSYGELVGLWLAGCFDDETLLQLSHLRGCAILEAAGDDRGTMAAIMSNVASVEPLIADIDGVVIANINGAKQTVISGLTSAVDEALEKLKQAGIRGRRIPVACAFHSPVVAAASQTLRRALLATEVKPPQLAVWSNTTAAPYGDTPAEIVDTLSKHLAEPVRFVEQIEAMHADGARFYIEVGPGRVLTNLAKRIVGEEAQSCFIPVSGDAKGRIRDLLATLGRLSAHGFGVDLGTELLARGATLIDFSSTTKPSPTTWLVNGHTAWPAHAAPPEPVSPLGQAAQTTPHSSSKNEAAAVVLGYLENMRQLVIDQSEVVLSYLGSSRGAYEARQTTATRQQPAEVVVEVQEIEHTTEPDNIEEVLIGLVSERTGYPPEMLDLDLDLEAALSIDSIKRIEILGALGEALGLSANQGGAIESLVEELAAVKTLRGILEWLESRETSETDPPKTADAAPSGSGDSSTTRQRPTLQRYTFSVLPAPLVEYNGLTIENRRFAIVPGHLQLAQQMAKKLTSHGAQVSLLAADAIEPDKYDGLIMIDDRATADVDGLSPYSIFSALQTALASELSWALAVTTLGGQFGRHDQQAANRTNGLAGLVKSAAAEWPSRRIRVVDIDPETPAEETANNLYDELIADDQLVETGYHKGQRLILRAASTPRLSNKDIKGPIDEDATVLVTGGARGITAHAAIALAHRTKCHLVLVGRTPLEDTSTLPDIGDERDPIAVRKALIAKYPDASLSEIESMSSHLLAQLAMHATLAAIRAAGSRVDYITTDVRDEQELALLISQLYEQHGRIDGCIHGAGVIEDKLIQHKSMESFRRVYDTKVIAAKTLLKHLKQNTKFIVFFSSIAGAFGNRGQSDYAAANDCLDKLAVSLNEKHDGRVLSINWGPWSGSGMVSPQLEAHYQQRGIGLIDVNEGIEAFMDELLTDDKDAVSQVVLMSAQIEDLNLNG